MDACMYNYIISQYSVFKTSMIRSQKVDDDEHKDKVKAGQWILFFLFNTHPPYLLTNDFRNLAAGFNDIFSPFECEPKNTPS